MANLVLETLSISFYGHQIEARFTAIASGRRASGPTTLTPISGALTTAAPAYLSLVSSDIPAGTPLA